MHNSASPIEQEHIERALKASETAMDAISTIVTVSSLSLGILAVSLAVIALWGWASLKGAARETAKRIAKSSLNAYIKSDEFNSYVKNRIDKGVEARWQEAQLGRLDEEGKQGDDGDDPFPPAPDK